MHSKACVIFLSVLWCSGCTLVRETSSPTLGNSNLTESVQQTDYLSIPMPKLLQEQFAQALLLVDAGQQDQALVLFEKLHEAYPSHSGAAVNIAILLLDQDAGQNQAKAIEYLLIALERQKTNYFAMNRLAVIKRQQNKFKEAAALLTQAVTMNKEYALAWYNLGIINEIYLGQPQAAIDAYTTYLSLIPEQSAETDVRIQQRIERLRQKVCEGC